MTDFGNAYTNALRNIKIADVKMVIPQRRAIVDSQRGRCYFCQKSLGEGICHFEMIEGPDPKTGVVSKSLRALCVSCYFDVNHGLKKPVKEPKKKE